MGQWVVPHWVGLMLTCPSFSADQSISTFTSALWFNAAVAGGYFTAFLVLRRYRPRVYKPRTFLVEKKYDVASM